LSADPRAAAVANLLAVLDGRSLDEVLASEPQPDDERDRALAAELSYGVCRWYRRLDALLGRLLRKPLKARDRDLQVLMMVGAYQLLYSRVPPHAALSSCVEVTRRLNKAWASKLVNGVLRRLQREADALGSEVDRDPAQKFALPDWLFAAIDGAWPAQRDVVLAALQVRPPMTLRVDLRHSTRADYTEQLAAAGITAQAHPSVPSALMLDRARAVERLPGFAAGHVSVQDAGAQLAAEYLDLRPGQRVLDACAAPGGKTLAILQRAQSLDVTALDIDAQRLQRVDENVRRGGYRIEMVAADAASPSGAWCGRPFDRILVDVPCSASGVLRRHPDIRLLRRASDIAGLVQRQAAILDAMWSLLAPGGRLLYVTCSLLPAENADQFEAFVDRHPMAEAVELPTTPGTSSGKGVQLLPGIDDTDGFYYAAVRKPL
jgi:16S rRNA (cytosine967-C5)-methyltransferase